MASHIRGIIVPMITPFNEKLEIDFEALKWLVEFLEDSGVHGLFPASTTGEFVHLSREERDALVESVVEYHGRSMVLPGISSNNTLEAVEYGRRYIDLGVDGVIVTPPYYFKPRLEGVKRHFSIIAEKLDTRVVIYNIPSLTGITLPVGLVADLAEEYSNIAGMKITYNNFTYLRQAILSLKQVNKDFSILTGIADMLLPNLMAGGDGGIVALANFAPRLLVNLYTSYIEGELEKAILYWRKILGLSRLYDIAETPVVIKETLHKLYGTVKPYTRPPLLPLPGEARTKLETILGEAGLIPSPAGRSL